MKIKIIHLKDQSELFVGIALVKQVNNRIDDHTIPALLRAEESRIASSLTLEIINRDSSLSHLKGTFLFEMLQSVIAGRDIQRQNPLIDLCNLVSLRYQVPVAALAINSEIDSILIECLKNEASQTRHWSICDTLAEIYNSKDGQVRAAEKFVPQSTKGLVIVCGFKESIVEASTKEIAISAERLLQGKTELKILSPTLSEVELELP